MIVVTTPTGTIGRQVLDHLVATDAEIRVIVRDASRLPAAVRARVEVVEGSHGGPAVVAKALAGTVFWLVPPPSPQAPSLEAAYLDFTRPAIDAFTDRVVGISALGRGTPMAAHAGYVTAALAADDLITASGVAYRALTMPSFMENVLRQVDAIRGQGAFFGPTDAGLKLPIVATRDIAAVAARLLLDDTWTGSEEVPVLGPEDLSHDGMARIMTEVFGRPVRYQQVPWDAFRATMAGHMSDAMVQGRIDMMRAKNDGLDLAAAPRTRMPTTFRQWCAEVLHPAVYG